MKSWCISERLPLTINVRSCQEAVDAKSNEIVAIPALFERLAASGALAGALVTIDAIACNPSIAQAIVYHGADYLLAMKVKQPSLLSEMERFFDDAEAAAAVDRHTDVDKGHGRIGERRCLVSAAIDWMEGERHFPGEYRFPKLAAIAMIESRVETKAGARTERRFYITSRTMTAKAGWNPDYLLSLTQKSPVNPGFVPQIGYHEIS